MRINFNLGALFPIAEELAEFHAERTAQKKKKENTNTLNSVALINGRLIGGR